MEKTWNDLKSKFKEFCQSNGFNKAILGLSGGLDSAICAVLAADVLGGENVVAIMMRTKYTSSLSLEIAREIARLNQLNYRELDIQPLINEEISFLTSAFGENPKGLVIENLQARARGKILMAWSNQCGGVVLACGNKSEASTGYCTLYGDTCGGIMPIGNIYKTQIFELAQWRNNQSHVLPNEVIIRAPTAELATNQKDENFLPPYSLLDQILHLYLDCQRAPAEIKAQGFDEKIVDWVVKQYHATAFKRCQMPPSLII